MMRVYKYGIFVVIAVAIYLIICLRVGYLEYGVQSLFSIPLLILIYAWDLALKTDNYNGGFS